MRRYTLPISFWFLLLSMCLTHIHTYPGVSLQHTNTHTTYRGSLCVTGEERKKVNDSSAGPSHESNIISTSCVCLCIYYIIYSCDCASSSVLTFKPHLSNRLRL